MSATPAPTPAPAPPASWAEAAGDEGPRPEHFTVPPPSAAVRTFLRWFGPMAMRQTPNFPELGNKLAKARSTLVPQAYLAKVYGQALVTGLAGLLPLLLYIFVAQAVAVVSVAVVAALCVLPVMLASMAYAWGMLKPDLEIAARKRNLEGNLPYALNFMAALASAGVVPVEVFGALGKQPVYGEVAKEAAWIYRDAKVFSRDLVAAMHAAARRSPSQQFEDFVQGSINTITSGGDLKLFLLGKAEQFTQENRRKQKSFLESLGVMAESYVVVAAAAPLFLIVVLSVMALFTPGVDPALFLNLLIFLVLPILHGMFAWILGSMRPD